MTNPITSLSLVTGSTNTNSTFLWAVWNGKDYKVPLTDLSNLVGRNDGTWFEFDGNEAPGTGAICPWGSVQNDQNDFFDANSLGVCYIKNDRVTHIRMQGIMISGGTTAAWYLYKNGSVCTSLAVEPGKQSWDDLNLELFSPTLAVDSGDRFDLRPFDSGGDSFIAGLCHWQVFPVRYKE